MGDSISSTSNTLLARLTPGSSHLSRSGSTNEVTSKAEGKTREKRGKSAILLRLVRFTFSGRKEKHVDKADQAEFHGRDEDGLRTYSYKELHAATEGFSPQSIIGKGGSGVVYKGAVNATDVAVKMIVGGSLPQQEIEVIGKLRHPNLVRIMGYCHEGEHLFLVHEFVPNGDLSSHLYRSELRPLSWEVRYHKIVAGLISALSYLQTGWVMCVVHRDIKPSNILLDSDFNPKLTDFELARHANGRGSEENYTRLIAGTMGYMDPEYVFSGRVSRESDIYAFGVVLLEIACGRRPIDRSTAGRRHLTQWVSNLDREGKILEAADPRLGDAFDKQEMELLLTLGLVCTCVQPSQRPSIRAIQNIFAHSTLPPRDILPKQEMSNTIPTAQQGKLPYSPSDDVEDHQATICFELSPATPAEHAGGTSATSSSTIFELENEPAPRESSNSVPNSDQDEQKADPPAVQDHQYDKQEVECESGCWDIGIPPGYLSTAASPLKDHYHPVINGFAASLHKLLQCEDEPLDFDKVLKDIRLYTACLVSVSAPLVEWNSLAQEVLQVSEMMNAFPNLIGPRPTTAATTLSSLRANVSERTRAVDEHEAKLGSARKQLALDRREYLSLIARIVELRNKIEKAEEEMEAMTQATAQHREVQGRLSTILNKHKSALSKLSSFTSTY